MSLDTPAQIAMDYDCNTVEDKKSRGRASVPLPVLLFNGYHHFKQHKKKVPSTNKQKGKTALRELRKLASDWNGWAGFTKELCRVLERM